MKRLFPHPAVASIRYNPLVENFQSGCKGTICAEFKAFLCLLRFRSFAFLYPLQQTFLSMKNMKTSISTILSGKPPKGINKYMLEEVFFSESCKLPDEYNTDGGNNPQNARFVDGKYYFKYAYLCYNNASSNKAIELRKIDLNTGSLNLRFDVIVKRTQSGQTNPATRKYSVSQSVKPNQTTSNILESIARTLTNAFSARNNGNKFNDTPLKFEPYYNYKNSRASLKIERDYNAEPETHYFSWYLEN